VSHIIFYSWQSDLPNATNRGFIQTALERAAKELAADGSLNVQPVIDRDTQGVPGAPDISKVIFEKINSAAIVVADVSIVTGQHEGRPSPNPNVLFELGYALKAIGDERLILVFNTHCGKVEQLPFDLRMRRTLVYKMEPENADRASERDALQAKLEAALRAALSGIVGSKVKESVKIQNRDGAPEPLLVTGSHQSVQDSSMRVLYGILKIINYTQQPVCIAPLRLIVDGKDWPVHRIFFQRMVAVATKDAEITVLGNHVEEYRLLFMFPAGSCPEKKSGTVVFRIDGEERSYSVKFG
jgi:hypothetical protein